MGQVVLVTGASGFVGRHLLATLAADAETRLVGWSREPVPGPPGVAWAVLDITDREVVRREMARTRPDAVYHLAGATHVARSFDAVTTTLRVNAIGTVHLVEALCQSRPDARLLVAGSATVYRASTAVLDETSPVGPASPYALSKLAQEGLALRAHRDEGLAVIVARAFNHIGPGQEPTFFASSFARQVAEIEAGRRDPIVRVGNLDARRDLTDVRDVVRAYVALMGRGTPGTVYNVCSGEAHAVGDVLHLLIAQARTSVRVEVDPALLRPSDTPLVLGSYQRLHETTGWAPTIPLVRTLADLLDDWRERTARASARADTGPP